MKNKLQFLIFFSFILSFSHLFAKKKYALIIGINQYYDRPGLKYSTRLQGCVNDANTMKALLHNRFNFDQNDITVLTDEHATSKNVVTAFNQILQKVKAGDVFVFYFSGHG
ncbi:MAG TPA: caspase family protein, partial [Saprospiraceae bacterium]|nr:caspase family protein [Saprospiraceae bacterium]